MKTTTKEIAIQPNDVSKKIVTLMQIIDFAKLKTFGI